MGMIYDTIKELAKLNTKSSDGTFLMAIEVGGVYYKYLGNNTDIEEYKSLREMEGSEDWIADKVHVEGMIGLVDPKNPQMTFYWKEPKEETDRDKVVAVYPHKVKTASGRIVHLAT